MSTAIAKEKQRLHQLSFRKLKLELGMCQDPRKELYIRRLMKDMAIRYLQKKELEKKKKYQLEMDAIVDGMFDLDDEDANDDLFDDMESEPEAVRRPTRQHRPMEDTDVGDDGWSKPKKPRQVISKDALNKHMMDRMNSDLEIHRSRKKPRKDFTAPYVKGAGADFAPADFTDDFRLT